MRRHPFVEVIMITIALTAVGTVIVLNVPWLPDEASSQAHPMDTLYDVLAVASVFVFALVMAILIVSVMHFRRRHGDLSDGDPIHGSTSLEVVWTAIPAIIVTGAAVYSGIVLHDIEDPKPNTKTIDVTAQQFAWQFDYPDLGVKRAGELHLVKDTNYYFKLHAKDVLHSFWVPEFRLKKDAVPGMTTHLRIKPTRNGTYSLVCTELCGLGHSTMRARVIVQDQAAFDSWVQERKKAQPPAAPGGTSNQTAAATIK
jgi:cytochrome c oxidase subunit II